jgi:hypothetical protein
MDEIMKLPVAMELLSMIQKMGLQTNNLGQFRKIVNASHKPFNALMVQFFFMRMEEDANDQTISSPEDYDFINSCEGTADTDNTKIVACLTTCPSKEGYQDKNSLYIPRLSLNSP